MIAHAVEQLELRRGCVLFIENVGNLVCPASFDLGQHLNVTLLSTPEGHDKPAKYPVMFRAADLVLITKSDLLPVLDDFDPARAEGHLRQLASSAPVLSLAAGKRRGTQPWLRWLRGELRSQRERVRSGETRRPAIQPDGAQLHARNDKMPRHSHGPHTADTGLGSG